MAKFWYELAFVVLAAAVTYSYLNSTDRGSIRGKRVLITGASQNIGEEIAYQYARLGANVVITARREAALAKVVEGCKTFGAQSAAYIVADMSDGDAYESLIENAVKILGGLDILVLNHVFGRYERWNGSKENLDYLEKSMVVNYFGYVRLATAAMSHLKASSGQLIVVASQAGRPGVPNVAAYGGSKAAVINFFTSLQVESLRSGDEYPSITICILGAIDTKEANERLQADGVTVLPYSIADTASAIIDGGINRRRYAYAPPYVRFISPMREMSPELFDRILLRFAF